MNIAQIRNTVAGWVFNTRLPGSRKLHDLIMDPGSREELKRLGEEVKRAEIVHYELIERSAHCNTWLTEDNYRKVPGGRVVAVDALLNAKFLMQDYDIIVAYFESYVSSDAEFCASLCFFAHLPYVLEQQGWFSVHEGQFKSSVDESYRDIVTLVLADEWADYLIQVAPGCRNRALLKRELQQLCFPKRFP